MASDLKVLYCFRSVVGSGSLDKIKIQEFSKNLQFFKNIKFQSSLKFEFFAENYKKKSIKIICLILRHIVPTSGEFNPLRKRR
jgi:hypothetical protein